MLPPRTDPGPLQAPDVPGAVYEFLSEFVQPTFAHVFRGDQNRVSLPEGTNEFIVFTLLSTTRVGSNVSEFSALDTDETGVFNVRKLNRSVFQIDIRSDGTDRAANAASLVELWSRSEVGCSFFGERGVSVIGCTPPTDLTEIDESSQFVKRFMVELTVEYWSGSTISVPFFDGIDLSLKNTDVVFPPGQE